MYKYIEDLKDYQRASMVTQEANAMQGPACCWELRSKLHSRLLSLAEGGKEMQGFGTLFLHILNMQTYELVIIKLKEIYTMNPQTSRSEAKTYRENQCK